MKYIYRILAIVAAPLGAIAQQQTPSSAGIVSAVTGITADTFSPADIALVENRAKVYKGRLLAGTEYRAATDRDVAGKSPGQVATILSPPAIGRGYGMWRL
jgi:hypothetical protein